MTLAKFKHEYSTSKGRGSVGDKRGNRERISNCTRLIIAALSMIAQTGNNPKTVNRRLDGQIKVPFAMGGDGKFIFPGCCNDIPQTGYLQQQAFIFSQLWWLEVQDQDWQVGC